MSDVAALWVKVAGGEVEFSAGSAAALPLSHRGKSLGGWQVLSLPLPKLSGGTRRAVMHSSSFLDL